MGITSAHFVIPTVGEEIRLTFSFVGGAIDENVARWQDQFQLPAGEDPRMEIVQVDGIDATWVDLRGTFHAQVGENPGPHSNWRMLGVAIPMQPRNLYLKLTGAREAVADIAAKFRKFVKDAKLEK